MQVDPTAASGGLKPSDDVRLHVTSFFWNSVVLRASGFVEAACVQETVLAGEAMPAEFKTPTISAPLDAIAGGG